MFRRWLVCALLALVTAPFAAAHDLQTSHEAQFEFSETFIRDVWHYPVQTIPVSMECPAEATNTRQAGPVHGAADDCELHIGAALTDPTIGDFQFTVLEPPNICEAEGSDDQWRLDMDDLQGSNCDAHGVLRVWPEHLETSKHCSNPGHVLEVHPLLEIDCDNGDQFDFRDFLYVSTALGFKEPERVREMLGMHLWLRRNAPMPGVPATAINTVSFDYGFGNNHSRGHASNFGRLRVEILPQFIRRPVDTNQNSRGFATVIARVLPVDRQGHSDSPQWELVKLYAIEGTDFFANLIAREGTTDSGAEFDVVGIFTFDSLSITKVIEDAATPVGQWVPVPYPVSFIVFGERP